MTSTYQRSIDVGACKPAIPTAVLRKIREPRRAYCAPYRVRRACATATRAGMEICRGRGHAKYSDRLLEVLPVPSAALRLEESIFVGRDLEIGDQSRFVAVLRLLQGLAGRGHGRRLTDVFLLQLL